MSDREHWCMWRRVMREREGVEAARAGWSVLVLPPPLLWLWSAM